MIKTVGLYEGIPVVAFDFESGEKIGEYESMTQAAKKLYIRSMSNIYTYVIYTVKNSKYSKGRRGVKSYKGGKYHFELAKPKP
jgi:hypothetical protein